MRDNDDLLAAMDAMGRAFKDYVASTELDREKRRAKYRARVEAERAAAERRVLKQQRVAELIVAATEREAAKVDPGDAPRCGRVGNDSTGRETTCWLDLNHHKEEYGEDYCEDSNGARWLYEG